MKPKAKSGFKRLVCLGLIVSLLLFAVLPLVLAKPSSLVSPPAKTTELRGVWLTNVSSGVLFAPWGVNRAIKRLAQLNFNTIYPVVWNRGNTFYPSRAAKKAFGRVEDPFLSLWRGGSDVLAEIVHEGNQQGLSVIPWFEYGLIVPVNSALAQRHPDWLTRNRDGKIVLTTNAADDSFVDASQSREVKGIVQWLSLLLPARVKQQAWLNPFHPDVQALIKELILEVVLNYDVEGIQLDDHFGMPVEFGYDPFTINLYQREHQGKKPPSNFRDPEWMGWRAAHLTAFMSKIVRAVKAVKPQAKISLSPNSHRFSYQNYLQDWQGWVEKGLVDELILQVYRDDLKSFQRELSQPAVQLARRQIPVGVGISTGTWNRPVKIEQIEQQVKSVRDRGFPGVSFFYWETLWGYLTPDSPRTRRNAFRSLFAQPALRPRATNVS